MSCENFVDQVDGWVAGELDPATVEALSGHAEGCPGCRAELDAARRLRSGVEALRRPEASGSDLWPEIERRIRAELPRGRRDWRRWGALAAGAVVALGVAGWNWSERPVTPETAGAGSTPVTARTVSDTPEADPSDGLAEAEASFAEVKRLLRERIAAPDGGLDADTVRVVEDNLLIVETALAEIRRALVEHPEDRELNKLLMVTYRHQSELLWRWSDLLEEPS